MGALQHYLHDPVAVIGTVVAIILAWVLSFAGRKYFDAHVHDPKEHYRKISFLNTALLVGVIVVIAALWSRLFHAKGTFWGLIGAGVAVALKDPLLSIAGRIAIFAGHIYSVGDRIQITQLTGDVVDVGFFYTRMMELGNWIGGDQATGRIVQFSNSIIFGNPVYNYTQNFSYIWDEIQLPVTYASNVQEASKILIEVGKQYTHEFLEGAHAQMRRMQRYFLVPEFELEPTVYLKVTKQLGGAHPALSGRTQEAPRGQQLHLHRSIQARAAAERHLHCLRNYGLGGAPSRWRQRTARPAQSRLISCLWETLKQHQPGCRGDGAGEPRCPAGIAVVASAAILHH